MMGSTFKRKISKVTVKVASPEVIRSWSSGEVKKPETINYRTFKPEKDGLFCEKIFGPTKDYECACGKYKGKKYEGTVCERCGVRVESKEARRKRMGHIDLFAPVVHVWYLKSSPSILSSLLGIQAKELENVIYYGGKRIIEKILIVTNPKDTDFIKGSLLYQTEYEIYNQKLDFEVMPGVIIKSPVAPVISSISGEVKIRHEKTHTDREITWVDVRKISRAEHRVYNGMVLNVKNGDYVNQGDEIVSEMQIDPIYAPFDGTVEIDEISNTITIKPLTTSKDMPVTFSLPYGVKPVVPNNSKVKKGDQLTNGTVLPAVIASVSGNISFGKELNVRPLEDGKYEVLTSGSVYVENVVEEKHYPLFEGAFVYVKDGDEISEGQTIADRFLFEDEYLTLDEYKIFEQHYPAMFTAESEVENDRPIVVITEIDDEVSVETGLKIGDIITDHQYSAYRTLYNDKIEADSGASAIKKLLQKLDLEKLKAEIESELKKVSKSSGRAKKLLRRLKIVKDLLKSETKPEWMILEAIPVVPPDIRPMIQVEGGRFATTDLNDLYRRVINRNNRLKKLYEMNSPEIIIKNEKRMLQEAVDSLIYNGRMGKAVTDRNGRALKSLTDLLKGKKGRFRRNLLGKRVDYSGRAVIVVGPHLKIHECGLPKKMAMELFKPFVLAELLNKDDETSKTARKMKKAIIEKEMPQAYEVLEEIIKGHPVLLNRAPTLHRMSLQAFEPKLIEGNAIQLHPLVCPPFNADFDGDQMAVHVPLSAAAQAEAKFLMLSRYNIISPAHGKPISMPGKDIVAGVYYLTMVGKDYDKVQKENIKWKFSSIDEAELAYEFGHIRLHDPILVKVDDRVIKTTYGRLVFANIVPREFRDYNKTYGKGAIKDLVYKTFKKYGVDRTADLLDDIKDLGFHYATISGLTVSITDFYISPERRRIIDEAKKKISEVEELFALGFLSDEERYRETIKIWADATEKVQDATFEYIGKDPFNPVYIMVDSGARGNKDQLKQLAGMRGLMADPSGRTIEIPIISNFREGLSVLEFFISTHGARKGSADTALRTSSAGYLTRRLVDVAQSVVITTTDCGTENGVRATVLKSSDGLTVEKLEDFLFGRVLAKDVYDPKTNSVLVNPENGKEYTRDTMIDDDDAKFLGNYSVRIPVSRELEINLTNPELPENYCELITDFIYDGVHYDEGTEVNWDIIRKAKNSGLEKLTVKEYPIVGKVSVETVVSQKDIKQLVVDEELIMPTTAKILEGHNVESVQVRPEIIVRSVLTCEAEHGVCSKCYGMDLSNHKIIGVGEAVGVVAAQSIGEPGTQLTMRTFHTGGIATTADITQGLPRAEELFEARKKLKEPEGIFSRVKGYVKDIVEDETGKKKVYIEDEAGDIHEYDIPTKVKVSVNKGQKILPGQSLSTGAIRPRKILETLDVDTTALYLLKEIKKVYVEQGVDIHDKHFEIIIKQMLDKVEVIDPGDTDYLPGDLLRLQMVKRINKQILEENVHVETNRKRVIGKILHQHLIAEDENGEIVEIAPEGVEVTEEILEKAIKSGIKEIIVKNGDGEIVTYQILPKEPIKYRRRLLRITKASLERVGWLSAASFQQTPQVLTEAAIEGSVDHLLGLKENVIVGQLIPAGTGLDMFANIQIEETPRLAQKEKMA
ncbi:DNA-directed RNA polymerase subunit beta' [Thermosipho melanesiensis]|uniref:DNA-directed RNA polymerase subunit beta' n=2 Tax=Thermosipho melanesiensis TaxID=46541 RepID=RPOC_THEM4|nr:DNA-directed RNA polymerase subunit beta' [Thermosipho melanesiensis]A6LKB7.1 RecName: Full=DNA-directed RNA polymerase subunit beta'; Short=RNAP subunit beta'; AltName: Full=RNA polymerase subunit beta'; AltName: Full=Transcriptase subunit beta' [Thermosipho melanesiensis BI429]ABR30368.1 DNA-directed RNA polymerase, beta' subunit [Thermosipho melanesiensis BI429]APT73533.1 DNA-directed RNA polymerase subunit beta' [Thermosipho melanesiensis]OOC37483.1 DNA-directed RNA polymerase subunit be